MPILEKEIDLFPENLLEIASEQASIRSYHDKPDDETPSWWAMYTRSRHEKQLMRKLLALEVPFYGPVVPRRYRGSNGRVRTTYETLFSNYVFVYGGEQDRYRSLTTNCVSRCCPVVDVKRLTDDLWNVQRLIATGAPLTPESRVVPGERVRVRSGPFTGFEGQVIKRHGETRLLVYVEFMRQGASVLLEDCQLDVV